jgi:hypothetical protein
MGRYDVLGSSGPPTSAAAGPLALARRFMLAAAAGAGAPGAALPLLQLCWGVPCVRPPAAQIGVPGCDTQSRAVKPSCCACSSGLWQPDRQCSLIAQAFAGRGLSPQKKPAPVALQLSTLPVRHRCKELTDRMFAGLKFLT